MPSSSVNLVNFVFPNGLVKIPEVWSSNGQYFSLMMLLLTRVLMKWYLVSTCLVILWKVGFLAILIVDWLSINRAVGVFLIASRSCKIICSQKISRVASQAEMYFVCFPSWNVFCLCWRLCHCYLLFTAPRNHY